MIFTIRSLSFEVGSILLEGYSALAARILCSLALLLLGWMARRFLNRKVFPKLLEQHWRLSATPILLNSLADPIQRLAWYTGVYFALSTLPWAIPGLPNLLKVSYQALATVCICEGFYLASDLSELVLAAFSEEIRSNRTLTSLLVKSYKAIVVIFGVSTVAQELGLPIGSIIAGAGLVGLTISLAAQDTASNLFSGLMILLERPFHIGDWISVGDVEGTVEDINFRSTRVRALDNSLYILTNSNVCNSTINNGTARNRRLYRFVLGVTYDTSREKLEQLMADLTEMLKSSPHTYPESAFVRLSGFGASSIDLLVSAYVRTAEMDAFLRIQNDLNLNIMDVMERDGVSFAFPSTSVYLETVPESAVMGGAAR